MVDRAANTVTITDDLSTAGNNVGCYTNLTVSAGDTVTFNHISEVCGGGVLRLYLGFKGGGGENTFDTGTCTSATSGSLDTASYTLQRSGKIRVFAFNDRGDGGTVTYSNLVIAGNVIDFLPTPRPKGVSPEGGRPSVPRRRHVWHRAASVLRCCSSAALVVPRRRDDGRCRCRGSAFTAMPSSWRSPLTRLRTSLPRRRMRFVLRSTSTCPSSSGDFSRPCSAAGTSLPAVPWKQPLIVVPSARCLWTPLRRPLGEPARGWGMYGV